MGSDLDKTVMKFEQNLLCKKRLCLAFMIVVNQFQVHVDKERVEDLGQLCSVTVQNCFDKLFKITVIHLIQSWVSLLTVGGQDNTDIWLIVTSSYRN